MDKDIKKAVAAAQASGFEYRPLSARGHTKAWIVCPCGQHVKVFSSGRNGTNGAKIISRFTAKHAEHIEKQEEGEQ